jgi:hypothetical protein
MKHTAVEWLYLQSANKKLDLFDLLEAKAMADIEIRNGTMDSEYGYNVYAKSDRNRASIYFRVNPSGVEFMNDTVIHLECDEEVAKKVVEYCNEYFVRNQQSY